MREIVNGKSFGLYWCEEAKILSADLYSPRSYKILGEKDEDNYIEGHYFNHYKVRIESSNKSGLPIIHTWSISLRYSEMIGGQGRLGWCISSLRE